MDNESMMEVRFDIYCQKCKHKALDEKFDPCNDCLDVGYRANSEKPEYFEEDES